MATHRDPHNYFAWPHGLKQTEEERHNVQQLLHNGFLKHHSEPPDRCTDRGVTSPRAHVFLITAAWSIMSCFPETSADRQKKRPLCNLFLLLRNNRKASGVQAENKHLHLCHLKMEFLPLSLFLSTHLLLLQRLIVSIPCSCALRQVKPQKIGYWRHWSLKKNTYFFWKM